MQILLKDSYKGVTDDGKVQQENQEQEASRCDWDIRGKEKGAKVPGKKWSKKKE